MSIRLNNILDLGFQEIEDALRSAASKFGLDYDAMCVSENTGCKDWTKTDEFENIFCKIETFEQNKIKSNRPIKILKSDFSSNSFLFIGQVYL